MFAWFIIVVLLVVIYAGGEEIDRQRELLVIYIYQIRDQDRTIKKLNVLLGENYNKVERLLGQNERLFRVNLEPIEEDELTY